uniref:ND4L n=1 Tax=Euglena gracilis TaxID=3039 RepID=UPI002FE4FB4F|eukprot:EG_transcript_32304
MLKAIQPMSLRSRVVSRALSSGYKQFGGLTFKEVQNNEVKQNPTTFMQRPLAQIASNGLFVAWPGQFETVFDLLTSQIGPYCVIGLYLGARGCFKPEMAWTDRLIHVEASTFLLYGVFFITFASTPLLYWAWFFMLFSNSLKTLMFVHLSNPWYLVLDQPMQVKFSLKRLK